MPDQLQDLVTLDVRPMLAAGEEPFDIIMQAAGRVAGGGTLELTAPFDPVPLYHVLSRQGFTHATEQRGPSEYVVRFSRSGNGAATAATPAPTFSLDLTVGEVHRRFPATGKVLAAHGIDLCCGGDKTLEFAARAHGVDPAVLLSELQEAVRPRN